MIFIGLDDKITVEWVRRYAMPANKSAGLGSIPLLSLPSGDRDSGEWYLGVDRKHEGTTVLLYCGKPPHSSGHRKIGFVQTRRDLIQLYEKLAGPGSWPNERLERTPC